MAKKDYGIARGNVYQQAYNQMMGPQKPNNTYQTGQPTSVFTKAAIQAPQSIQQPNPVPSTQGGVMTQPQNTSWTRKKLEGMGINDIGWNTQTGTVTIGDKDYLKPEYVSDDGKSYAPDQDIFKAATEYYNDIGKPLKMADRYVATQLGVNNAVSWSDGNLMVGGQIVPTVYVDNKGTAYAHRADLDNAIKNFRKQSGVIGNQQVYNNWKDQYDSKIQSALDKVLNRKEWNYNIENDPAYQSYRDQYTREGDRAYQDAYAAMTANTGGYGSSAAMNAAGQQWNYYMQQMADRIPELQQNDYTRYLGEQELRRQALDSLRTVADDDYNKMYQANRDEVADINAANEASYNRRRDARADYEWDSTWDKQSKLYDQQIAKGDIDTENYRTVADLAINQQRLQNEGLQLTNEAQRTQNWLANAQKILSTYRYQASPDIPISQADAESIGLMPKADGTYPTLREIETTFNTMEALSAQMQQQAANGLTSGLGLGVNANDIAAQMAAKSVPQAEPSTAFATMPTETLKQLIGSSPALTQGLLDEYLKRNPQ